MLRTTEEIKTRQTAEETTGAVESGQRADTGGASVSRRTERKAMVSWAAMLDEAVKKPAFINEAYSRFHNYSLGNQLLALFQCFERGIQPGPLLLQFPYFNKQAFPQSQDFLARLSSFLDQLPRGRAYGVELRRSRV